MLILVIVLIYLVIGVIVLFSDLSQPRYNRPMYIMRGSIGMMVMVVLLWPAVLLFKQS